VQHRLAAIDHLPHRSLRVAPLPVLAPLQPPE
jgi:hypothetical protein